MNEDKNITSIIESEQPTLSPQERSVLWSAIAPHLPVSTSVMRAPIVSPYQFIFNISKNMTALVIALLLVIGSGGTALASDAARPGDFLFPLERTLEDVQMRLALSEESKLKLSERLTKERLEELREIVDEELIVSPTDITEDSFASLSTASTTSFLEIEADVFTDTTVVKMELSDKKFYFETNAQTREEVAAAIFTKFPTLTIETILAVLDFEVEDRASVPRDRGIATFSEDGQVRVDRAVKAVLSFLDGTRVDESVRGVALSEILKEVGDDVRVRREGDGVRIDSEDDRLEIRMDDDGDSRFEVRSGDERIRIETKDGEVRVKTREGDDDSDDRSRSSDDGSTSRTLEVEADVFFDTTVVAVEINDVKSSFVTNAITKDAVAAEVATRYGLTKSEVLSVIDFEVEDRASRTDDTLNDDRSDDDRDDEDEDDSRHGGDDDDEDEDEDDSRHGGDDDDEDEDDSRHGGDDDDEDNSGHGGGDDDDDN
jgi:uncharacterized protein (DUF433 family)